MENFKMPPSIENKGILYLTNLVDSPTGADWDEVDSFLSENPNDLENLEWARKNTKNSSSDLRDLAATIFEASDIELSSGDISILRNLIDDEGYPGFRAACALAKRINVPEVLKIKDYIKEKLEIFINDPDVSEIAEDYLKILDI